MMPTVAENLNRNADAHEAQVLRTEKALVVEYRKAYDTIAAKLAKLYEQMGDEPSLAEARRYKRLEMLQAAIADEYRRLTKTAIAVTEKSTARAFADGVYGTEWAYDQALGVEISWPVLSVEAIRASVYSAQSGDDFAQRFKNWANIDYIKMNGHITQGLAQGYSYAKTARVVRDDIKRTTAEAMRIVRTESGRAYTQGHLETYGQLEELGIEARKRWVATLDTRTRDTHGALDGEFADKDGLFWSNGQAAEGPGLFNDPAEDINCRCRIVEEIDDMAPEFRRIRGEGIVPYQSFETWARPKGWTPEKGWPAEAKAQVTAAQAVKY